MNRRAFLRTSSLLAAAGVLGRVAAVAQSGNAKTRPVSSGPAGGFTEFRPLRRNVGIFTGRGGTIGWLASPDSLVVVDTQFPDTAALCLAGLPQRGRRQLDVVLNTHHHFDHTSGNPAFRPVARTIVAQANVPKLQFEAAKRAEADQKGASTVHLADQVYADTTFADVWRHEFRDEVVTAQYFGPAHTGGDAVIMFEKANVVHVGDLVFNRMYPVIDPAAGASARNWIKVLDEILNSYPADAIYVFGHGNPKFGVTGKRDDVLLMRDYWTAVVTHVEKEIAAGRSRAEILSLANLPGFSDFHAPLPNRLGSNLAAVYDELTEKKG
jgi:glyoxylase-like metal-dependent hydrolase (beta-lactamase superfamily II)